MTASFADTYVQHILVKFHLTIFSHMNTRSLYTKHASFVSHQRNCCDLHSFIWINCSTLCPFHTTGGLSRGYRCSLAVEPPPRSPHFIRVIHTTGGVIHVFGKTPLSFQPTLTLYRLIYTVDHTFSYCSKKFICACSHSSANAHSTIFRGRNLNISKLL